MAEANIVTSHSSQTMDLLDVRRDGTVVRYELKGYTRAGRSVIAPTFYEWLDQALAYLINPVSSPLKQGFADSIFDYVYLVHPPGIGCERMADVLRRLALVGLIEASPIGTRELVKPKLNPYVNAQIKALFLQDLSAFAIYSRPHVNPIQ